MMALFKRKRDDAHPDEPTVVPSAEPTAPAPDAEVAASGSAEPAVGISVSSYGGFGSAARQPQASQPVVTPEPAAPQTGTHPVPLGPEFAPVSTETLPGLRDNVLVREALAQLPENPTNDQLAAAARNLLQGHLFLRVKGDARALLAEGKEFPLAVGTRGDQQFVLVYSSGAALGDAFRADGDSDTSAMGQPVLTLLRFVLASPYAGIIVDSASAPARAVYPRALLERMLAEVDPELSVKTLLAGERTAETVALVADALTTTRFWLAVNEAPDGRQGVAEARTPEGDRLLEIYTHPLEVIAMGRGDRPAPMTGDQLARALRADEELSGVIIDPAGPWIRLTRDELAPVLAG